MKNKFKAVIVAVLLAVSISAITGYSKNKETIEDIQKDIRLFSDAFMIIKDNYVEPIEVKDLVYGAIKGMIGSLDAFSQFMEPDVADIVKSDTEGEFGGLGIRITTKDGYVTVITPLPDTPAYRMGIMPGDQIVKIEGESAKGITLREAVKKLRGPKGTKITISVAREDEDKLLDFTITRDRIVPKKIYTKMLDGNIGYIKLTEFTDDAPDKFKKALEKMVNDDKVDGLVVDLRNNPGGLLSAAVKIAGYFIEKGKLIVYTKGRREDQNREFKTDRDPITKDTPMVILINKGSASASEIVAGCMKDHRRGIILGEKSFGKASVQSIIDMEDGSALRLTTAHYYTPSGNLIHGIGIAPDIKVTITKEQRIKLAKQEEDIYNLSEEEKKKREEEKIVDPQLERAHDLLIARKIFMDNGSSEATEEKEKQKK